MNTRSDERRRLRVGVLDSHPIQYHAPWLRGLAQRCDLHVFFAHRQSSTDQAKAGYGVAFDWDLDPTAGYAHEFLRNRARAPNVYRFSGCDTPDIGEKLREHAFDVVLVTGWYLKTYWQAVFAAHRLRIPVLVRGDSQLGTPRHVLKRLAKQLGYRWVMHQFDGFLAVGTRNAEYLNHYGARRSRIHRAPHFVDESLFRSRAQLPPAELHAAREHLGTPDGHCCVLFVGRLIDFKRPLDLLHAAAALRVQGDAFHLAFVGAGPLAEAIEALVKQLGVSVTLLGFRNQSELPALYAAADLLALPSDARETWGLVVNEAMCCGLPAVVSAAVGCAPDLIDNVSTGHAYACGDIAALATAMLATRALSGTEKCRQALAEKMHEFSCERAVDGTMRALEAVTRAEPS